MTGLWRLPVPRLAGLLDRREISAVELLEHFLARTDALDGTLNTVIERNPRAREAAAASDARRAAGAPLGPLDGIPFTVKDNILTEGLATRWGSPAYRDHVPAHDETPVARLKAAGAVVIGKTNVPEFTLEGFTDNALFGPTPNPWDTAVTPGGSSGGAVAGVAAGLAPFAIGTDGGGSIRRPCGYAGLFGLKPSIGRLARVETLPQILHDMEVVGPIARDVASAAMVFAAMEGEAEDDPRSRLAPEPGRDQPLARPPARLRILHVERFGEAPLDPVIAASTREVARALEALGHEVTGGDLPIDIGRLNAEWPKIGQAGLAFLKASLGPGFDAASPKYRAMAAAGEGIGGGEIFSLFDLVARLRIDAARAFTGWDIILTPSSAAMPWPIGTDFPPTIDGREVGPRGHAIFTGWVNAIGHPAVNVPGPPSPDGMPIGSQLVAGFNRDWTLLRLALQLEQALGWTDRWPAIAGAA